MKFSIKDLDAKLFQSELGMAASDHPHIYMQWLQIKLTDKVLFEMKELNEAMKELNNKFDE